MQSERHIKRLVRELELPEQADLVIQRRKYWTPRFASLYLAQCDELERVAHLGEALTVRGFLYDMSGDSERAVADWSEAIACTDPACNARVHFCASHNLAGVLTRRTIRPKTLTRVMKHINEGRAFLAKTPSITA